MVLVSHKYKFIYIKNIKVAGTSVEAFFGRFCIDPKKKYRYKDQTEQLIDEYGIIGRRGAPIEDGGIWKNHIDAKTIKAELGDIKFSSYFKFAIIRNPYDALVSLYFYRGVKDIPFKQYAKYTIVDNYSRTRIDDKDVCDYYIKYENLVEDIINVCKILNIDNYDINDLPNFKAGKRPTNINYRDYYDEETKMAVYKNHEKTFELFGYTF
jgi:hypothetical protein